MKLDNVLMQQQLRHIISLIQNEELNSKNIFMAGVYGGSFHPLTKFDLCCLGLARPRVS